MEWILKWVREKNPETATITRHSPSQTQRGRGNRQNQTRAYRKKRLKSCNASVFIKKVILHEGEEETDKTKQGHKMYEKS